MEDIKFLDRKIREIERDLKFNENLKHIERVDLEINLYNLQMKKSKLEGNLDEVLKFKKKKLQKEIEYIELIEGQKDVGFLTLEEFLKKPKREITYLRTYIDVIDRNLKNENQEYGGIPLGAMIQFAAQSYAGKTTTSIRILLNLAKHNIKVAHFNFEMSENLLHKIYTNLLKDGVSKNQLNNLVIVEDPTEHIEALVRDIKILFYRQNVKVFLIDSRMKITTDDFNKKEVASTISRELSKLVRELGITIILINQLSEEAIKENRIVLKESGDQFYDADIIFALGFVYEKENGRIVRDENNQPKVVENERVFLCKKNRFGMPFEGIVRLDEIMPLRKRELEPVIIEKVKVDNSSEKFEFDEEELPF